MGVKRYVPHLILVLLVAANAWIFYAVFHEAAGGLRVSVLDIGQGDSILIQGPTGKEVLVDGGPTSSVLAPLGSELGMLDRTIDLVVETHPDRDHIGGLPSVFDRYRVAEFMEPGIPNDTAASAATVAAANAEPDVTRVLARRGMRLDLGGGAYADVLYPDRDPSRMDTNNGSIVLHVVYGNTSFMLTGDLPSEQEGWLVMLDGEGLKSDVLKAGHHGSKYSSSDEWLAAVSPSMVAISAGKDNSYGHPAPETIERIQNEGATIYSTIDLGTLHFVSDGSQIVLK
jgi:competence protein ComEC